MIRIYTNGFATDYKDNTVKSSKQFYFVDTIRVTGVIRGLLFV